MLNKLLNFLCIRTFSIDLFFTKFLINNSPLRPLDNQLILFLFIKLLFISRSIVIVGIGGHPSEWKFKKLKSSSKILYFMLFLIEKFNRSNCEVWSSQKARTLWPLISIEQWLISLLKYLAFLDLNSILSKLISKQNILQFFSLAQSIR